ncbi:hypothetical protein [Vibrio nigripulchritudo]|uniref:hypothetical protein n=1 Tax=Vibrio nigripulchritudo TaxID=28173 RepID=UPI0003B1EFA6|nr:hypothetical protein [Vibrio nigripulchritudo]CCN72472.1 membrane hypothetical protein [Vibrio nigripulchritudo SFn118]
MQLIAILLAILWTAFQVGVLSLSLTGVMGFIGYDPCKPKYRVLFDVLHNFSIVVFICILLTPVLSVGIFWYSVIGISSWDQLILPLIMFAIWIALVILFGIIITVRDKLRVKRSGWG